MNNSLVAVQNSLVPSFLIHPIYDVDPFIYSHTFVVDMLYGCAIFPCAIVLYQFSFLPVANLICGWRQDGSK